MNKKFFTEAGLSLLFLLLLPVIMLAQDEPAALSAPAGNGLGALLFIILLATITLLAAIYLAYRTSALKEMIKKKDSDNNDKVPDDLINKLEPTEIDSYLNYTRMKKPKDKGGSINSLLLAFFFILSASLSGPSAFAQTTQLKTSLFSEGGVIITLVLILTPILVGIILMIVKVSNMTRRFKLKRNIEEAEKISKYLKTLPVDEVSQILRKRKEVLDYKITQNELSGTMPSADSKGILKNVN